MAHFFDEDIAVVYGVNAAIIIQNIFFWVEKNRMNNKNFFDGTYWTYNSIRAFEEMFPYMSAKQIRSTLKKLEDEGLIVTGNYNDTAYDRTKWYAMTDKGNALFKKGKSILPKGQINGDERANQNGQKGKPIPDSIPDNKPDSITASDDAVCPEPEQSSASEPAPDAAPGDKGGGDQPVIRLPLNDGTLYDVMPEQVSFWSQLYPAVDVMQELRNIAGWMDARPTRRKTRKGIKRCINSWLAGEQDSGRRKTAAGQESRGGYQQAVPAGGMTMEQSRELTKKHAEEAYGKDWDKMQFDGWD